jgi:hypothetical protein
MNCRNRICTASLVARDNPIGWLEVTDRCTFHCQGCYRINGMQGHKPLEQVRRRSTS